MGARGVSSALQTSLAGRPWSQSVRARQRTALDPLGCSPPRSAPTGMSRGDGQWAELDVYMLEDVRGDPPLAGRWRECR